MAAQELAPEIRRAWTSAVEVGQRLDEWERITFRSGTLSASDERDSDQAWFWTDEWQAKEREADEALRQGRFERFESEEAFEAALEARQHLNADT
jgi:hypothetical protein